MIIGQQPDPYSRHDDYVIVLPHVFGMLNQHTMSWAHDESHRVHAVQLDAYNPYAYGQMLQSIWNRHGHLMVVEQDVVPTDDAVTDMLECDQDWCTQPYPVNGMVYGRVLGCTRFSAKLQAQYPYLMWQAASNLGGSLRLAHWRQLNEAIIRQLDINRINLHQHGGQAAHHHDYGVFPDA